MHSLRRRRRNGFLVLLENEYLTRMLKMITMIEFYDTGS